MNTIVQGICKVCGCTEAKACVVDGKACSWWDRKRTLCNYCAVRIHHCHADYCGEEIPRKMLMCAHHWGMVPPMIQAAIYNTYQKGQEHGKPMPSRAWIHNVMEAKKIVRALEEAIK